MNATKIRGAILFVAATAAPVLAKDSKSPKPPEVVEKYDKFTDVGTLRVSSVVVAPPGSGFSKAFGVPPTGQVEMTVVVSFDGQPGKSAGKTGFVTLNAISVNRHAYLDDHRFGCIVNGKRNNFETEHDSAHLGRSQIAEGIIAPVPMEFIRLLGAAKTAECRLGSTEFSLSPAFIEGLRILANRSNPDVDLDTWIPPKPIEAPTPAPKEGQ